jgi:chromosome segregation protein
VQRASGFADGVVSLFDTADPVLREAAETGPAERLCGKVRTPWPLGSLLGNVYAVEDLEHALTLRPALADESSVIVPDGTWLGRNWVRFGSERGMQEGIFARERELKELDAEIDLLAEEVDKEIAAQEEAKALSAAEEHQREQLQEQLNRLNHHMAEVRSRLADRSARLEQLVKRRAHLEHEVHELHQQVAHDELQIKLAQGRLEAALSATEDLDAERERLSRERDALRAQLQQVREQVRSGRSQGEELAIRVESMRSTRASALEGLARLSTQLEQLGERRDQLQRSLEAGRDPLERLQAELDGHLARRVAMEDELAAARGSVQELESLLHERERERIAVEQKVRELQHRVDEARMGQAEVRVRCQSLEEQIAEGGLNLPDLLGQLAPEADASVWQARLEELTGSIQRLGPINLAAIDEYGQQAERVRYLDSQHADLTEALATLESAIRKIDAETRSRFRDTYERVNAGLQDLFPPLFGGGEARLEMTGNDLLDTGIALMARPPGKRNSSVHQLSGGEKALTAVALVFSIFILNPAPFCMLDEVDAPLDDANVSRFCELLHEMSDRTQFILITHNKATMQTADHLTGVTMHEPGVSRLVAVDVEDAVRMAATG